MAKKMWFQRHRLKTINDDQMLASEMMVMENVENIDGTREVGNIQENVWFVYAIV